MDLAIAIRIGNPTSSLSLVKTTIESIETHIGECTYRFIISLDPRVPQKVKDYVYAKEKKAPHRFELFPEETLYWADFINRATKSAQDCDYFIKSHDDIELLTPDFFPKVKRVLEAIKVPVGWISFDELSYTRYNHWCPPTRPGWYKDIVNDKAWQKKRAFQFHNLPDNWWRRTFPLDHLSRLIGYPRGILSKYQYYLDLPSAPVKCHAPWNMFVMIKTSVLKRIGLCENWQTYNALLVDEDWGLRALQKKYWNIWIPFVKYIHTRSNNRIIGNRSSQMVQKDAQRVHTLFKKKWGFKTMPTKVQLQKIKAKHKDNFIPWSITRNSYDWDYIKLKREKKYPETNEPLCYLDNYQELYKKKPGFFDQLSQALCRLIRAENKQPLAILDIGCGFGDFLTSLRKKYSDRATYHGLTLAQHEFDAIKKNKKFIHIIKGNQKDLQNLYSRTKFDVIINFHTLSYIRQPEQLEVVGKMLSLMNPGGFLVLGLVDNWAKISHHMAQHGNGFVQFYYNPKLYKILGRQCRLVNSRIIYPQDYRVLVWQLDESRKLWYSLWGHLLYFYYLARNNFIG